MRCFMLAVSQASTLDRYTNNFSLFFLLEEFRPSHYPARLSVHSHAFFEVDADEIGAALEVRLLLVRGSDVVFTSDAVAVKPAGERHRVRVSGLMIPEPGQFRVAVEWRRTGSEGAWTREAVTWPVKANVPLQ